MEKKYSKKIIISFVILLLIILGLVGYIVYDKVLIDNKIEGNNENYNTYIEIYKKDNDYKVYLKNDSNKEIEGYKLYKAFGINISENEVVKSLELNLTDNKLNGIIINYDETVDNKNAYSDLNNYYKHVFCSSDKCVLNYDSYYNLETNNNMFKNMKVSFDIWNDKYLVSNAAMGQWYYAHQFIVDIDKGEIIITELEPELRNATTNIYFLTNNEKKYIYVNFDPMSSYYDMLYNFDGKLISNKINQHQLGLKCTELEYCPDDGNLVKGSHDYIEFENDYFHAENEKTVSKYDLNGTKISNTKKYDEILYVGIEYSLIYQKNDNSVYIIKNDDTFIKRVDSKNRKFYNFYQNKDGLITISASDYDYIEGPDESLLQYTFNPKNDSIALETFNFRDGLNGKATVTGYPTIDKITGNIYGEDYEYVYFNIIESSSQNLLTYIENSKGNTFVSDRSIGIGCIKNGSLNYVNQSDEFGMKEYNLTKDETTKIMTSTKEKTVKLELEKLKLTDGVEAPNCYSHITKIKVID